MVGRDENSSPIQYRTWVVDNEPDFTASQYTGLKSGDNPLIDIKAYAIFNPSDVVDFNLPLPTSWKTTRQVLPIYTCDAQIAVIDGYDGYDGYTGSIYLFGGQNSNKILQASLDNPATFVDTGATLPTALAGSQLAILDGYIYLFGGTSTAHFSSGVDTIFSASVNDPLTWTNHGSLLPNKLHHSQLAIVDGYLYLMGGNENNKATNVILQAHTSNPLSWTNVGSLPNNLYGSQLAIMDGYIVMMGGITDNNVPTANIYSAPLSSPTTWMIFGALPYPSFYGQFATIGAQGYLFTPTNGSASFTKILKCNTDNPFVWTDTLETIPGLVSQSQLAICYDRIFLYGGNGSTVIFANDYKIKYPIETAPAINYGEITRTEYNAASQLDLFRVLGFAPWRTDYGS